MSRAMRPERRAWGPSCGINENLDHEEVIAMWHELARAAGVETSSREEEDAERMIIHDWPKLRAWVTGNRRAAVDAAVGGLDGRSERERARTYAVEFVDSLFEVGDTWDKYVDPDNPEWIEILVD